MSELYVTADGLTTENSPADMGMRAFPGVSEYAEAYCGVVLDESDMKDVGDDSRVYEVLSDYLADFLHLVNTAGVDPEGLVSSAMRHFLPEKDSVPA